LLSAGWIAAKIEITPGVYTYPCCSDYIHFLGFLFLIVLFVVEPAQLSVVIKVCPVPARELIVVILAAGSFRLDWITCLVP